MICTLIPRLGLSKVMYVFVYFVPIFAIAKVNGRRRFMARNWSISKCWLPFVLFWKCPNLRNKSLVWCLQWGYFSESFTWSYHNSCESLILHSNLVRDQMQNWYNVKCRESVLCCVTFIDFFEGVPSCLVYGSAEIHSGPRIWSSASGEKTKPGTLSQPAGHIRSRTGKCCQTCGLEVAGSRVGSTGCVTISWTEK